MSLEYSVTNEILKRLRQSGVSAVVKDVHCIEVHTSNGVRRCTTFNLEREISLYPCNTEDLIQRFVDHISSSHPRGEGHIYPRLIPRIPNKPIHHPWVDALGSTSLDVAIVEHTNCSAILFTH